MKENSKTPLYATSINVVIGCLFKYIRNQAKIDQEKVANAVGLSVSTISKIELGNLSITIEHIYLLCRAYQMPNIVFFSLLDEISKFLENNRIKIYVDKSTEVQNVDKRNVKIEGHAGLLGGTIGLLPIFPFGTVMALGGLAVSLWGAKKNIDENSIEEKTYELPIMHNKQLYMSIEEFFETVNSEYKNNGLI